MVEQKPAARKLSMKSTKQQMLEAYNELVKQLQEKDKETLSPEKKTEEKKKQELVQVADSLFSEGVLKEIGTLKLEIGKMLAQISDGLEEEVAKYEKINSAIELKEKELHDVYEIERSAASLAALIEAQNQKRLQFESEMTLRKEELEREIEATRATWKKERDDHEAAIKERDAAEQKRRERDKEEFAYAFKREQQLTKDKFEDEKAKLEAEIQLKKEHLEKLLAEREKAVSEKEHQLKELQDKVDAFPEEMETAVAKATQEVAERIRLEAKNREEFLKKEFDGEKNVLKTKIEALEKTAKEQNEQVTRLTQQLERAYQKVEDIAAKTVAGPSESKTLAMLHQIITEQTKKPSQEK